MALFPSHCCPSPCQKIRCIHSCILLQWGEITSHLSLCSLLLLMASKSVGQNALFLKAFSLMPFMGLFSENYSLAVSRGWALGLLCGLGIRAWSREQLQVCRALRGTCLWSCALPQWLSDCLTQAAVIGTLTTEYYRISDCFVRVCF